MRRENKYPPSISMNYKLSEKHYPLSHGSSDVWLLSNSFFRSVLIDFLFKCGCHYERHIKSTIQIPPLPHTIDFVNGFGDW